MGHDLDPELSSFFSTLCSTALGLDPAGQISFSQRLLIATGLMTMLQSLDRPPVPCVGGTIVGHFGDLYSLSSLWTFRHRRRYDFRGLFSYSYRSI